MLKNGDVVGHIARKISSICGTVLRSGTITCGVSRSPRYSADLPQGGLEVLCVLSFRGDVQHMEKTRRLLQFAMASSNDDADSFKKRKLEDLTDERDSVPKTNAETVWVKRGRSTLYTNQKTKISAGD